ncbi:hypothetical protein [Vitreimonas flagellata]|uniref:hypothetical protein n=1 Tax=Vitreimonas flagellata TaxID=2560861 RepID=UPI001074F8F4|nr:hypothetical protein [Vitreimonas flagellata]
MKRLIAAIALTGGALRLRKSARHQSRERQRDARAALAGGDNDLVGVCGLSCAAPGATPLDEERLGARMIENTIDYVSLPGEAEYNDRAHESAVRHNRVILAAHD